MHHAYQYKLWHAEIQYEGVAQDSSASFRLEYLDEESGY